MTEKQVLELFVKYNALLKGHFRLSSGLHSGTYLQCALMLQYPDIAEKFSKELANKFSKDRIGVVIGPAMGGITLAYEVARALGTRGIFAEREAGPPTRADLSCRRAGAMTLRRGFSIAPGERALVVEDVVTTGASTKEVAEIVKTAGAEVAGVGCIIDRSEAPIDFGARFERLAKIKADLFKEEACPLCKSGAPIVKPGSRK